MDAVVAGGAEQDAVVQVGGSGVSVPPAEVVDDGHAGWGATGGAAAVALCEGEFLGGGEEAFRSAPVEDVAGAAEDAGDDLGVGGEAAGGGDADRGGDTVDGRRPGAGLQVFQGHPDDHGGGGALRDGVAAERVSAQVRERIRPHLRHRAGVLDHRAGITTPGGVPPAAEHPGDESFDGRVDGCGGFRVEPSGEDDHAVPVFVDGQGAVAAPFGVAGFDTVGVEVGFGAEDEFLQLIQGQSRCAVHQHPLHPVQRCRVGAHRPPVARGDDHSRRERPHRGGVHGGSDVRVLRRGLMPGERHPRCGGFPDPHRPGSFPGRGADHGGDHHRRRPEPVLPGQGIRAQLGAGLPADLRRHRRECRIRRPPQGAERLAQRHQLTRTEALRPPGRAQLPGPVQGPVCGGEQILHGNNCTNHLRH
ncbi:MAG: hypothetical protein NT132_10035 [Microbacterium sp.]|nr:hypothetical protein [Microbacterium sp.]MCX6502723.1 hypothetical protein [Microbacterium sp.]